MTSQNWPTKRLLMESLTRRELIQYGGLAGLSLSALWALACQQEAPAGTPTKAPAAIAPTPTTPPAAPTPTKAPAGTPTPEKIGARLIGKLEGPEVITDPTKLPKTFNEAPALAELSKAGKLPSAKERIGEDPLVIKPVHEIGKYGGTWRRGFNGPADYWCGVRAASGADTVHFWDYTGDKVVPNIAKGWEVSDEGRTITGYLRRGMRWSDGQPFTADDFLFWYEDMHQNKDLNPTQTVYMSINSKPGKLEKVDTYSVRWKFPDPYYLFPEVLAGHTPLGGQAVQGMNAMGSYAPAHYLKQFHPKYVGKEALDKLVKEAKFDNWVSHFKFKNSWHLNPELPAVSPWKTTTPANTPTWTMERNPYSTWVDTEGNQLPYIDKIVMTLGENLEIINLRAIAGEYDFQERHIDLSKLPVFLANQEKGGYRVYLDPGDYGGDMIIKFNMSYEADPEIAKWINTTDFRRALAIGIDRDQINEAFWLGTGTPSSVVPADHNRYNPGPEYRTMWAYYDPKKANEMLDKIGLDKKDAEGYRVRTDGKGRLRLEMQTMASQTQFTQIGEMIKEHWKKIGIDLFVQEVERSLGWKRNAANETQLTVWNADGTEHMFTAPQQVIPYDVSTSATEGPLYAMWLQSNGTQGKEPPPKLREVMEKWKRAFGVPEEERVKLGKEIWKTNAEEVFMIGVVGLGPASNGIRVVKVNMGNVPSRQYNSPDGKTPSISRTVTLFWKK